MINNSSIFPGYRMKTKVKSNLEIMKQSWGINEGDNPQTKQLFFK